jgi:hypothetical protein
VLATPWHDYYSSHDLVPNGPIDVDPEPEAYLKKDALRSEFYSRQHEVINRRSIFSDHTSYWSSPDDFVARVADLLAEASKTPIAFALDEEWRKVSLRRRLWRVGWLSRCRAIAALSSIAILAWPRYILESAASHIRELTRTLVAKLPEKIAMVDPITVPDWLIGAGGLVFATCLVFLLAAASWSVWEKQEIKRFFQRKPHRSIGVAGWIFALGWLGILVLPPAYGLAHAHQNAKDVLCILLVPSALAVWSVWLLYNAGHGPGAPTEWGEVLLSRAEKLMSEAQREPAHLLWQAQVCFAQSHQSLGIKKFGSDAWARALVGETQAIEKVIEMGESTKTKGYIRARAQDTYRNAIDALTRSGRDASEIRSRLDKIVVPA